MPRDALPVVLVEGSGSSWIIRRCPWCKRTHSHGRPSTDTEPGTRVSHCHLFAGVYRLVEQHEAAA